MAFTKLTTNVNNVQGIVDRPNSNDGLTAAELKAIFDKAGSDIKAYINNTLTPELDSNTGLNIGIFNVKSYGATGDGVADDTAAIKAAKDTGKTIWFPDGTYMISSDITITNNASFLLSENAVIKASTAMDDMIVYNNGNANGGKNRFIKGGVIDGDGLAKNCLRVALCAHLVLESVIFKNPINRGVKQSGGYELIGRNLFFNNDITTNTSDNIAIDIDTSDAIFETFVITNFTTGVKVTGAANYFSNGHIWGNQSARLPSSTGILNLANANVYDKIYFDTCAIGFDSDHTSTIPNCTFNINRVYRGYLTSQPIYIKNSAARYIVAENCYFEYTNQGSETYKSTVVGGTNPKFVQFINCYFPTPATLDGVPISNRAPKIYKTRFNFNSWPSIPGISAGSSYFEKEITLTSTEYVIESQDTIIFNTSGSFEAGLVPTFYTKTGGIVGVRLQNVTNSAITPSNRGVYMTVIKNADETYLPFETQA